MATLKLYSVGKLIRRHSLMLFSKTYCPFCLQTKALFRDAGVSQMKVLELDEDPDGHHFQQTLKHLTGQSTVPMVFIGGDFIGGATEVKELYKSGKLIKLLKNNNLL